MSNEFAEQIKIVDVEIARCRSLISKLKSEILHIESDLIEQQLIKESLTEKNRRLILSIVPIYDEDGVIKTETERFNKALLTINKKIGDTNE